MTQKQNCNTNRLNESLTTDVCVPACVYTWPSPSPDSGEHIHGILLHLRAESDLYLRLFISTRSGSPYIFDHSSCLPPQTIIPLLGCVLCNIFGGLRLLAR